MINGYRIKERKINQLLQECSLATDNLKVLDTFRGGNNELLCISVDSNRYVIKFYNKSDKGRHNRLEAEWTFLELLKAHNVSQVPLSIGADDKENIALYSYIPGRKLEPSGITFRHINQAANFVRNINTSLIRRSAAQVCNASESAFSYAEHFELLNSRIQRLFETIHNDFTYVKNIGDQIFELKKKLNKEIIETEGLEKYTSVLTEKEKILSASDFGFHNVIQKEDGELVFIDFEYSGWDDPAKLAADFFFQPQVPVDPEYFPFFLDACLSHLDGNIKEQHIERAKNIFPIIGLRWVCIILNIFDKKWAELRFNHLAEEDLEKIRKERLILAKKLLERVIVNLNNHKGEL